MPALRRRTPDQIMRLAAELRNQLSARLHSDVELMAQLEQIKFRDPMGDTWSVGPQTQTWYLHRRGRWIASQAAPAESLDGVADIGLAERPEHAAGVAAASSGDAAASAERAGPDPAAYFREAARRVRQAYDGGSIDSEAAEAQLAGLYAVDAGGTAWMLGARSGEWYTFSGRGWVRAATPLDESILAGGQGQPAQGAVEASVRRFLMRAGDLTPEPLVATWTPPSGYPERIVTCPNCAAPNVGDVAACISCDRPLGSEPHPTPRAGTSATPRVQEPSVAAKPARQEAPALAAPVAAPTSDSRPARVTQSRTLWFIGGCFFTTACVAIAAALIFGLAALLNSM